jgi:hypothetical protein
MGRRRLGLSRNTRLESLPFNVVVLRCSKRQRKPEKPPHTRLRTSKTGFGSLKIASGDMALKSTLDLTARLSRVPFEDPDSVDERRSAVGLEPLALHLAKADRVTPMDANEHARWQREYNAWLR